MIITFYTPTLKLTGGNLVMFQYAKYLASQENFEVYIIAPDIEKKDYIQDGINIKTFKKVPNKYFEHIFFQLIYLKQFFKLTPKSDIIIPIFFPLVIHAIYCKKAGKTKKVISLFQDSKTMYWFGCYIYFLLRLPIIINNIDDFIAVSTPIAKEILQYAKKEAIIIPNGIDTNIFYPRNVEKENYILFIGSSKTKGVKEFVKSYELVKQKFPELKAIIVGPNLYNTNNPDITFLGTIKDKDKLALLYSKALVYVSQSYGDSFGLPPLEAMACGTAVVLTDTVGSREYAVDGENSIIVPIKNIKKTSDAIIKILKNKELREKLEKNAIKTASQYNYKDSTFKLYQYMRNNYEY